MPSCGSCVTFPKMKKARWKSEPKCLRICTKLSWLNGLSSAITRNAACLRLSFPFARKNVLCVRTAFHFGFPDNNTNIKNNTHTHLANIFHSFSEFMAVALSSWWHSTKSEHRSGQSLTIEISVPREQSALVSLNAAWLTLCSTRQLIKNGMEL